MTITTNYETNQALMTDFHHVTALATRRGRVLALRIFYTVFGLLGLGNGILLLLIFDEIDGNPTSTLAIAVLGVLFGSILYRLIYSAALRANVPADYMKLVSAVIVGAAIAAPTVRQWAAFQMRKRRALAGRKEEQ